MRRTLKLRKSLHEFASPDLQIAWVAVEQKNPGLSCIGRCLQLSLHPIKLIPLTVNEPGSGTSNAFMATKRTEPIVNA